MRVLLDENLPRQLTRHFSADVEVLTVENYLTDGLGVKVDLVMRDALKPAIGEHVLRELVPV